MIRFARPEDGAAIAEIYRPFVENTTYSYEYESPSAEEMSARICRISQKHAFLVLEEEGEIVGYAYNSDPFERKAFSWCAELSIYLKESARGRGYGAELVSLLETIAKRQGFCKMYSLISGENPASLRFHEKIGYRFLFEFPRAGCKFGRWVSLIWLEKDLNPYRENPPLPVPIEKLCLPQVLKE